MLNFFYRTILPLTMAGSATMLVLLVLTPLVKQVWNSIWQYYARLIPLVVFIVPFHVLPLQQRPPELPADAHVHITEVNQLFEAVVQPPLPTPSNTVTPLHVMAGVWAVGVLLFAMYKLFVWVRFYQSVRHCSATVTDSTLTQQLDWCKENLHIKRNVVLKVCEQVGSPMLMGIFQPAVILPNPNIFKQECELIFLHELTHCKRRDLVYKLAALVVNALHWFNPLMYLLSRQINELCELSCDETLVQYMDKEQRRAYGFAILNQMNGKRWKVPDVASSFSGGKNHLKRRLHLIMSVQKTKKLLMIVGILAVIGLSTVGVFAASTFNPKATKPQQMVNNEATNDYSSKILLAPEQELKESTEDLATVIDDSKYLGEPKITLIKPVTDGWVSAAFWSYERHTGTDYTAPEGTEILAAASGTVAFAKDVEYGYGKHIILDHGDGVTTLYAHCKELLVEPGDVVQQGDVIAVVGKSGTATGYHCHFEVCVDSKYADGEKWIEA